MGDYAEDDIISALDDDWDNRRSAGLSSSAPASRSAPMVNLNEMRKTYGKGRLYSPFVLALCDEVEALRAKVAAAPILAEHAAAVSLLAASPVGDLGFVEGIEALRAQLAATLRLGRGPTAEEFRRHNATGGGWLLQGVGEDMGGWTMEMRPIPEADIPAMVRFTRDAIPLDASRQPCGVGVKV